MTTFPSSGSNIPFVCTLTKQAKLSMAIKPKNNPINIMINPAAIFVPTSDNPRMIPLKYKV